MNNSALLLELIQRYVAVASRYAQTLRSELQHQDLLHAVRSHLVPEAGAMQSGAKYRFHGVGCSIDDSRVSIDFDFGPQGRSDGFDAWRLHAFAREFAEFASLHDLKVIEQGLIELTREGRVIQPCWSPNPHLLYLSGSTAR
jgi:hypothetical protein